MPQRRTSDRNSEIVRAAGTDRAHAERRYRTYYANCAPSSAFGHQQQAMRPPPSLTWRLSIEIALSGRQPPGASELLVPATKLATRPTAKILPECCVFIPPAYPTRNLLYALHHLRAHRYHATSRPLVIQIQQTHPPPDRAASHHFVKTAERR